MLDETELDSALQLLVERAQYITGATGTALALAQGEEMVCRASAGASAPAVGARLQVRSGLTGESIARRQLLRCDNAETDARVNLETCQALGIASIVVLPLLRHDGEIRGLFELFSDHPYAFEERDLIALERMAELTLTALDLAEQRQNFAGAPLLGREQDKPVEASTASGAPAAAISSYAGLVEPAISTGELAAVSSSSAASSLPLAASGLVPEAMLRVQKCSSCGFPVSEGRTLCLDCERKDKDRKAFETKQREKEQAQFDQQRAAERTQGESSNSFSTSFSFPLRETRVDFPAPEEFVPAFLANAAPVEESWLANPLYLLAIVVAIVGILVAVVVFR